MKFLGKSFLVVFLVSILLASFSVYATGEGSQQCSYTYSVQIDNNTDTPVEAFQSWISFSDINFASPLLQVAPGESATATATATKSIDFEVVGKGFIVWDNQYNQGNVAVTLIDATLTNSCDNGGDDNQSVSSAPTSSVSNLAPSSAQLGRPIAVLPWGNGQLGFSIFTINRSGQPSVALSLSPAFLADLPDAPSANTEYASSDDGFIRFYVLTTGEYQLNFGPDFEGKVRAIVFNKSFKITNSYEFRIAQ